MRLFGERLIKNNIGAADFRFSRSRIRHDETAPLDRGLQAILTSSSASTPLPEPSIPLNPVADFDGIRVRCGKRWLTASLEREERTIC